MPEDSNRIGRRLGLLDLKEPAPGRAAPGRAAPGRAAPEASEPEVSPQTPGTPEADSSPPPKALGTSLPRGMADLRSVLERISSRIPKRIQPTVSPGDMGPVPMNISAAEAFLIRPAGDVAFAELGPLVKRCPTCQGEGQVLREERGYEILYGCPRCGDLRRRRDLFNEARIPSLYSHKTLDGFVPSNDATGRARAYLQQYVRTLGTENKGVLLVGPPGGGKTHLVCGVIRHLTLNLGRACLFKDFFLLLGELREGYERGGVSDIMRPLSEVDVLVIDELGKGRNREWEINLLDEIVGGRYNKGRITLFTTNFPIEAPAQSQKDEGEFTPWMEKKKSKGRVSFQGARGRRGGDILADRVSDRVMSRLMEMCVVLPLETTDFRPYQGPKQPFLK